MENCRDRRGVRVKKECRTSCGELELHVPSYEREVIRANIWMNFNSKLTTELSKGIS